MDEQEVLKQIRELQNQRTSLKKQDTALVCKIMDLRDELRGGNIKNGCYYTDTHGLFCRVCSIEDDSVLVCELDTIEYPCLTKKIYYCRIFKETYCIECTKEEYDNTLDKIVKHFKD